MNGPTVIEFLVAHRMFGVLPKPVLAELATDVIERTYQKGHHLYYPGDGPSYVFVVRSGLVMLTEVDERGNERVVMTYAQRDVFGVAAIVLGRPHTQTATAVLPTAVLLVRKETFKRLHDRFPELAAEVVCELTAMLHRAERAVRSVTQTPVAPRMAKFLLQSAAQVAGSGLEQASFDLGVSRAALALLVGTTRQTVSRVLARLARAKLIAMHGREVVILRPDGLRRLAEN